MNSPIRNGMPITEVPYDELAQLIKDQMLLRELADAALTVLLKNKLLLQLHGGYPVDMETECRAVIQRLGAPKGSTNT